jgi:hypothetical protein
MIRKKGGIKMKKKILVLIAVFMLSGTHVFADDVSIDSYGNVETGVSRSGNLEVTGASAEKAIVGLASGTGGEGVRGENITYGNFGILGGFYDTDDVGVYGFSSSGYAGYLEGNARVTGDLTVDGVLTGFAETDPVFSAWDKSMGISITESQITDLVHFTTGDETDPTVNDLGKATLPCSNDQVAKWNGFMWRCADDTDTVYSEGTGLDLTGTTFSVDVPLTSTGSYWNFMNTTNPNAVIFGENSNTNGVGVRGKHGVSGSYGSLGSSLYGVSGYSSESSGAGVRGKADGAADYGVYGEHIASGNYGYIGDSTFGVYGYGDTGGVKGESSGGTGIVAQSDSGYGILGLSNTDHAGFFLSGTAVALKVERSVSGDASMLDGTGYVLIGDENSTNIVIDVNEIIARSDGNPADLYLNKDSGDVVVPVLQITGGSDIAEPFRFEDAGTVSPGMVVAIDPERPGQLRIADRAYDRTVAGIISGANGINPGMTLKQEGTIADGSLPVALTGRVYALADASYGTIRPGDLLTTSDNPGHVMKVTDHSRAHGTVLGKAMSSLQGGQGHVLVLVTLQ